MSKNSITLTNPKNNLWSTPITVSYSMFWEIEIISWFPSKHLVTSLHTKNNSLKFGWQTSAMDQKNNRDEDAKKNKPMDSSLYFFCILSYFNMSRLGLSWWMVFATVVTLPPPSISHRHLHPRSEAGFKRQSFEGLRAWAPLSVQQVSKPTPKNSFKGRESISILWMSCSFDSGFNLKNTTWHQSPVVQNVFVYCTNGPSWKK